MKTPLAQIWAASVVLGILSLTGSAETRPNIIVVVADDVSPAYLSCYGGRTPTPNLDRLAATGVRFDRAYSVASLCNPTRYTLFTGRYPGRNLAVQDATPDPQAPYTLYQNTRLLETEITLARTLGAAGYTTGHVGKWHSNFEYGSIPAFPNGGDVNDPKIDAVLRERTRLQASAVQRLTGFDYVGAFVSGNLDTLGPKLPLASKHNPEAQTQAALEFIATSVQSGKPFYLHLANTIPHSPDNLDAADADPRYSRGGILDPVPHDHPARSTIRTRLKAAGIAATGTIGSINAGMIFLDDQIGALLTRLEALGQRDNTIIVFVGDHSVVGKGSPYAQGNHVPFLISWPAGLTSQPRTVPFPVSLIDIVPTLLALSAPPQSTHSVDGLSLVPALHGESPAALADRPLYLEIGNTRSIIHGQWQYIAFRLAPASLAQLAARPDAPVPDIYDQVSQPFVHVNLPHKPSYYDADQLYDLAADPFCKVNLAADPAQAGRLATLRDELSRVTRTLPRPFPLTAPAEMLTEGYRRTARAQYEAATKANAARYEYDVERAFNLNLPSPEDPLSSDPSQRVGKLPGQIRE
jgi:arylsulfatase A-like enzyme